MSTYDIYHAHKYSNANKWGGRGFGDLGRMAISFQEAREHWKLFYGIWGVRSQFWGFREPYQKVN